LLFVQFSVTAQKDNRFFPLKKALLKTSDANNTDRVKPLKGQGMKERTEVRLGEGRLGVRLGSFKKTNFTNILRLVPFKHSIK